MKIGSLGNLSAGFTYGIEILIWFDLIWFDLIWFDVIWFDLIVLFYMDSLNETRSHFYINVQEVKKALIKDIGPVNRVHLTVLVSIEKIYIFGIG